MNIFDENKKFFMHMLFLLVIVLWVVSGIVLQSLFPELADRGAIWRLLWSCQCALCWLGLCWCHLCDTTSNEDI